MAHHVSSTFLPGQRFDFRYICCAVFTKTITVSSRFLEHCTSTRAGDKNGWKKLLFAIARSKLLYNSIQGKRVSVRDNEGSG